MKKKIYAILAIAALGMVSSTALAIGLNSKVNDYHEVHAATHNHDGYVALPAGYFDRDPASSGSYYLADDYVVESSTQNLYKEIGVGVTVNLCLNGHILSHTDSGGVASAANGLFHLNGGTLNIYDCQSGSNKRSYIIDNKRAVIDNVFDSTHESFTGGCFYNFKKYPIVTITGGTVNWYGGGIIGNSGTSSSGQLCISNNGELNVYSGKFIGNNSYYGMIYAEGNSVVNLGLNSEQSGNIICHKNVGNYAGVLYSSDNVETQVWNAEFTNNTALYGSFSGGAIFALGNFECHNSNFRNNTTASYGGAIYVSRQPYSCANKPVTFEYLVFEDNEASEFGGAVYIETTLPSDTLNEFSFRNCNFYRNTASYAGGAINIRDKSTSSCHLYIYNSDFEENTATSTDLGMGGAIFYEACTVVDAEYELHGTEARIDISAAHFKNNSATDGGALYISTSPDSKTAAYINMSSFTNNSATGTAGAIYTGSGNYAEDAILLLSDNTEIKNNSCGEKGGGIYANNALIMFEGEDDVIVKNNTGKDDAPSNIYIPKYSAPILSSRIKLALPETKGSYIDFGTTPLGSNSSIGISMEEIGDFTKFITDSTATSNLKYFFSDDSNYTVQVNSTTHQLKVDTESEPTPTPDPDPSSSSEEPTPTPSSSSEGTGTAIYDKDGIKIIVEDDIEIPSDVTIRVEVRAEVKEASSEVDYNKIKEKLSESEYISKVYDVKLIKTEGGVETEIQPSDIKEGLKIKVKITLPSDVSTRGLKVLHIHSVDDMEFVEIQSINGRELTFEVSRLSQFAFINNTQTCLPGWAIALIIIGGLLLLCCLFIIILFFIRPRYTIDYTKKKVIRVIVTRKHDNMLLLRDTRLRKIRRNEEDVYKNKDDASNYLEERL